MTNGDYVTVSLAIEVDGLSILVVAYSSNTRDSHFISFVSDSIFCLIFLLFFTTLVSERE